MTTPLEEAVAADILHANIGPIGMSLVDFLYIIFLSQNGHNLTYALKEKLESHNQYVKRFALSLAKAAIEAYEKAKESDASETIAGSATPVHDWFGLSYAAYFVLPRLSMQEMSLDWQDKFLNLIKSMGDSVPEHSYEVRRRNKKGQYITDPWANYRRSSVEEARELDKESEG